MSLVALKAISINCTGNLITCTTSVKMTSKSQTNKIALGTDSTHKENWLYNHMLLAHSAVYSKHNLICTPSIYKHFDNGLSVVQ